MSSGVSFYSSGSSQSRTTRQSARIARDAMTNVDNSRYGPVWDEPPASCVCCVCCGAFTTSAIIRLLTALFAMAATALIIAGMILPNATFTCSGAEVLEFALWEVKGDVIGKISTYSDPFVLASRILLIVGGAMIAMAMFLIVAGVFVVCCFCIQRRREDIYSPEGRYEEAERQRRDRGVSLAGLFLALLAFILEVPGVVIMGVWNATKMPKLKFTTSTNNKLAYRNIIAMCGDGDQKFKLGFWLLVAGAGCTVVTLIFIGIDACVKPNPKPETDNINPGLSRSGSFSSSGSGMSVNSARSRQSGRSASMNRAYSARSLPPPGRSASVPPANVHRRGSAAPLYPMEHRGVNPLYNDQGQRTPSRTSSMRQARY